MRVHISGFRATGLGFRVRSLGFGVQGLGCVVRTSISVTQMAMARAMKHTCEVWDSSVTWQTGVAKTGSGIRIKYTTALKATQGQMDGSRFSGVGTCSKFGDPDGDGQGNEAHLCWAEGSAAVEPTRNTQACQDLGLRHFQCKSLDSHRGCAPLSRQRF